MTVLANKNISVTPTVSTTGTVFTTPLTTVTIPDPDPEPSSFVFGSAISTSSPGFATQSHGLSRQSILSEIDSATPIKTNGWHTNLYMGTSRVAPQPYQVTPTSDGLSVCMAASTVSSAYITTAFVNNIILQSNESTTARKIEELGEFHVKHRWDVSAGSTYMRTWIVQGMAYATMYYNNLTPKITTDHAILSVNGSGTQGDVTGTKFKITLNNDQTWIIYASSSITLNWQNSGGWRLLASSTFTGTIRVAYLTESADETDLDTYSTCYPTSGSVNATISTNTATITFTWTTSGSGSLLHCALPHHIDVLQSPTTTGVTYSTIRGTMTGIVGTTWTMQETLTTIQWDAPRSIDADKLTAVQTALDEEESFNPDLPNDPYFGGKQLAKSGRLACIAEVLGDTTARNTQVANIKTNLNAWLNETNTNKLKTETTWKGVCATNGITDSGADFGAGYYNDHHFHWGYLIYASAVVARFDSGWLSTYQSKVNALVRDIMNPSASDPYFPQFRTFDWFEGHSWASGLFDFGDAKNQESTSEACNAWWSCMLWGISSNDENIKEHARILLAMETRSTEKYWQIKSADTIYGSTFGDSKVVGVLWATKVDYATFFGANTEFIHMIQNLPVTPYTESFVRSAWMTEAYPYIDGALTRSASLTASVSGGAITGVSISSQAGDWGKQTPNISFSGGGGSGGAATAIMTGSPNQTLSSISVTNGGSGYATPPTVSLDANTISNGWKNIVYCAHAVIDKSTAWTEVQTLGGYDDGNSKTNTLYWVATRP